MSEDGGAASGARIVFSRGARIELRRVARQFPRTGPVVDSIQLSIAPGEFISFLGPSGCGKSTLLRMIAGLDQPDSGEVQVTFTSQAAAQDSKGARGFVFQEAHLLPWRTVLGNVVLPLELSGYGKAESESAAREALKKVGLSDALDRYPSQLSGGMKMRASVARALVTKPRLLLLDEPFSALDEMSRHRLQEELRELWRELQMTVIFVTHSVAEAAFLSERALVMSHRPARVLLDRRVDLPKERTRELRSDARFIREVDVIGASYPEVRL